MDELIRKQTVLNMIDDVQFGNITHKLSQLHEAVRNYPSVDAVEVVRCKDCIHFKHGNIRPNYCEVFDWSNEESDYCSFAERRTDE